jgi:hypothetical protein
VGSNKKVKDEDDFLQQLIQNEINIKNQGRTNDINKKNRIFINCK